MKLNGRLVNRMQYILTLCRDKEVLNLGCADITRMDFAVESGQHLHLELSNVARRLIGIDIEREALKKLSRYVDPSTLKCYNVENLGDLSELGKFDVIVCGELIEHLNNPGSMLEGAWALLKSGGLLVVTTPNAWFLKFFLHSMFRGQDVSSDYHTCIFSPKTLKTLLERYGYKLTSIHYSVWQLPSWRSKVFALTLHPLLRLKPYLADTIIATAQKPTR